MWYECRHDIGRKDASPSMRVRTQPEEPPTSLYFLFLEMRVRPLMLGPSSIRVLHAGRCILASYLIMPTFIPHILYAYSLK